MKLGGNDIGIFQTKTTEKNSIGEKVEVWKDALTVKGILDYVAGESDIDQYDAKLQETSHLFMCDYISLAEHGITSENARMNVNGAVYQILMIDDVMKMHEHLEIYLKYVGAGLGV